jgi:hypothetical protein
MQSAWLERNARIGTEWNGRMERFGLEWMQSFGWRFAANTLGLLRLLDSAGRESSAALLQLTPQAK